MKKYNVIYADPPWSYGKNSFPSTSNKFAYPTLETERIARMPVAELIADDAVLFLWTTMLHIPDALKVVDAWGFRYVTNGFTWVKTNPRKNTLFLGMGYWTRQNAELCLLAKRGNPKRFSTRIPSVIIHPRGLHSQKPDIIRNRITSICGNVPRLELFARQRTPGWDVWGNEVVSDVALLVPPPATSDCKNDRLATNTTTG